MKNKCLFLTSRYQIYDYSQSTARKRLRNAAFGKKYLFRFTPLSSGSSRRRNIIFRQTYQIQFSSLPLLADTLIIKVLCAKQTKKKKRQAGDGYLPTSHPYKVSGINGRGFQVGLGDVDPFL